MDEDEKMMTTAEVFKQYLEQLFSGKRSDAREYIFNALDRGAKADRLLKHIIWPAMEQIGKLYREDQISRITEHMAARINRMIADQLYAHLPRKAKNGKRLVVLCGRGESAELGAQVIADLFEMEGWSVWFLGAGVPNDEVLQFVGKITPDVLCIFGAAAEGVPDIRRLITLIREVGVCEDMQILVSGGVFNRADGLADEVKADLFAANISQALKTVADHPVRIPKPDVPEPGRRRKRKRTVATKPPRMRKTKVKTGVTSR